MWLDRRDVERELRDLNRNMIAFDLLLGSGALLAPTPTLTVLGHDEPSEDAEHLFRRCGPIWLTFAAAHLVAHRRGQLARLVGARLAARDRAAHRHRLGPLRRLLAPGRKAGMWFAGASQPGDGPRLRAPRPQRRDRSASARLRRLRGYAAVLKPTACASFSRSG